jgi:hypothetical protein
MSSQAPRVSVVMPVHNAGVFLDAAVESILAQTWADFEFAIYDDCSQDGSWERALAWAQRDPRIVVNRGEKRLGPVGSSNAAAAMARAPLVARMDADDLSRPDRLALQVAAFEAHPEAVLVGSTFEIIDGSGGVVREAKPGRIGGSTPPFAHPNIMYRRDAFDAVGGYREGTEYFEDLDLYLRLAPLGEMLVINSPLLQLRFAGQNARLLEEPADVLRQVSRQYPAMADGKLPPMSFYSVAVLAILKPARPRLLGLMIGNVSFSRPLATFAVLAMIALAEVSPRLARALSGALASLRERNRSRRFTPGGVYPWRFPAATQAAASEARRATTSAS